MLVKWVWPNSLTHLMFYNARGIRDRYCSTHNMYLEKCSKPGSVTTMKTDSFQIERNLISNFKFLTVVIYSISKVFLIRLRIRIFSASLIRRNSAVPFRTL